MRVVARHDTSVGSNLSSDLTSAPLKMDHLTGVAISVNYVSAGHSTGTFTLEATASDPFTDNVTNTVNPNASWTTISGSATAVDLTDDDEVIVWNVEGAYYRGIRLVWDAGSVASGSPSTYFTTDWSGKGPQS